MTDHSKPWQVARAIPAPAAASATLRDAIAQTPEPPVEAARDAAPRTAEHWARLIAARDGERRIDRAAMTTRFGVRFDDDASGAVPVTRVTPATPAAAFAQCLFVYLHGGAYVFGAGDSGLTEAVLIAVRAGIPVLSIDYRMPPAHPYPAALDDALAAYAAVLEQYPAQRLALGGTSAGAGLTLALLQKALARGLAVPAAAYLGTPWADLTKTGDSLYTNEGVDRVLVTYDGTLGAAAQLYANGRDLREPGLSPIYGAFEGMPPTMLVTGTRDMFLSDTARTHRCLRDAGVAAELHVVEGASHADHAFELAAPESKAVYAELQAFLVRHLAR